MKLLKEPLLHFLLLGAVLFAAYRFVSREDAANPQGITVSAGHIEHLASTFAKVWQRPPSEAELKAQIDQYVKEEMLSREAVALGLDKNDAVIRRRLQQKMEFLTEDFTASSDPTDTELADYLARHPDQFAGEPRFTFRQVFLSSEKRGDRLPSDASRLLADLKRQGTDASTAESGDSTLLPRELVNEPGRGVSAQFGASFVSALAGAKTNEWTGPIKSAFGLHLVFVSKRAEPKPPELAEVREQVKRELLNERRLAASRRFMDELLKKYHVVIEWPKNESKPTALNR